MPSTLHLPTAAGIRPRALCAHPGKGGSGVKSRFQFMVFPPEPLNDVSGADGGLQDGAALQVTWLILEFCDKGSLQDAMDRGAFRSVRIGYEGSVASP